VSVISVAAGALALGGFGMLLWALGSGRIRSAWHFTPRALPEWSWGELARVLLLTLFIVALLPFARFGIQTLGAFNDDPHVWMTSAMLILDVFVILAILAFAAGRGRAAWRTFGWSTRLWPGAVATGLRGYVAVFPWLFILLFLAVGIARQLDWTPPVEPIQELIFDEPRAGVLALTALLACVIGPLAEELFFRGLLFSTLRRRMSRGLQFQTSYTWSKATDHDSDSGGTQYVNNVHIPEWRNPGMNWGPSNFDLRHNFVSNLIYEFPINVASGWRHAVNGWSSNFILTLTSGPPLGLKNGFARSRNGETNPAFGERPNLKPGFTHEDIVLGDPARYYNPDIFELQEEGTYGNLGRHVVPGPSFASLDFSLFKRFPIREATTLQFRAEFFNLLNHPNFQVPEPFVFTDATGRPNRTAGRIASTVSSSRQIQLGLRLVF